jgi:heme/copper-type cytochrome/quinol oxidase subunit 2
VTFSRARCLMLFPVISVFSISLALAQETETKKVPQPPVIIDVTADNFEFTPSTIHVKVHQNIELHVVAQDKTHGIRIKPFADGADRGTAPGLSFVYGEDCFKMKKDELVKIAFVAVVPGTYTFECCKLCGSGHKRMKGQIIAEP